MNSPLINLSANQLRRAAAIKEQIESLQTELNQLLATPDGTGINGGQRRRRLSAAGIGRIRAAQKARWAKVRLATKSGAPGLKRKRRLSRAARARLPAM